MQKIKLFLIAAFYMMVLLTGNHMLRKAIDDMYSNGFSAEAFIIATVSVVVIASTLFLVLMMMDRVGRMK